MLKLLIKLKIMVNDIYKNDFMLVNYKVTSIIETKSKKQVGFIKIK